MASAKREVWSGGTGRKSASDEDEASPKTYLA